MRMTPPLRGVWASAAAESASPKPATIAIFFSVMFSPTQQEHTDQRFDHPQRIGCKGGRPDFVKPGLQRGSPMSTTMVWRLISRPDGSYECWRRGVRLFPASISFTASRRQALPAFPAFIAALCYKFQLRKENHLRPAAAGDAACCRSSLVSAPLVASTDDISESQFSGATLISRIAR